MGVWILLIALLSFVGTAYGANGNIVSDGPTNLLQSHCALIQFDQAESYLATVDLEKMKELKIRTLHDYFKLPLAQQAFYQEYHRDPTVLHRFNPWRLSKTPVLSYREAGVIRSAFQVFPILGLTASNNLEKNWSRILQAFSKSHFDTRPELKLRANFTPQELGNLLNFRYRSQPGSVQNEEIKIQYSPHQVAALCAWFDPYNVAACQKNFDRLVERFYRSGRQALGSSFLVPILTQEAPARGARAAARKILLRAYQRDSRGTLFEDIFQSFREEGYSAKDSENWTWDLIFLAFQHGQNGTLLIAERLQPYNAWALTAAAMISSASVYLDSVHTLHKKPLYSIPRKTATDCDSGKPYHFWVTAYAARDSRLQGHNTKASVIAPFMMNMGYQMLSQSEGRYPQHYLLLDKDQPTHLKNRLDMSYAAAGAHYGVDRERSITRAYEESQMESRSSRNQQAPFASLNWILEWLRLMAPKAILQI